MVPGVGGGDLNATFRRAAESGPCSLCCEGLDDAVECVWVCVGGGDAARCWAGGGVGVGIGVTAGGVAVGVGVAVAGRGMLGGVGGSNGGRERAGADTCFNHESSGRVVLGGGGGGNFSSSSPPPAPARSRLRSLRSFRINAFIVGVLRTKNDDS